MGRPPKYHDEIEKMLDYGNNPKEIASELNINIATVYRVLDKLKKQARLEFKNLMQNDYLWKYQKTLENFDRTIRQTNEAIDKINAKYDNIEALTLADLENTPENKYMARATLISNLISIQSNRTNELQKLTTARDKASDMKAKVYNAGPVVNAIDEWVHQTTPTMGELPHIKELDSIKDDTENVPTELNTTSNDNTVEMTEEDRKVLEEMENDE